MDHGASQSLPTRPSEEDFCVALRNGLILCNVLNRVNPGAVHKVVDNPVIPVQSTEAAAQSAIQYFENMRNFLMAVGKMKLLTFEASHLEGGSSNKVVDCILCLKGFYEWKQAGGIGVWRYGGTVRITSLPMESPFSSVASDSTDESVADSEASHCEHILDFLSLSSVISTEESRAANALAFLFDHFGVGLILAYLNEQNGIADFPLNATVVYCGTYWRYNIMIVSPLNLGKDTRRVFTFNKVFSANVTQEHLQQLSCERNSVGRNFLSTLLRG